MPIAVPLPSSSGGHPWRPEGTPQRARRYRRWSRQRCRHQCWRNRPEGRTPQCSCLHGEKSVTNSQQLTRGQDCVSTRCRTTAWPANHALLQLRRGCVRTCPILGMHPCIQHYSGIYARTYRSRSPRRQWAGPPPRRPGHPGHSRAQHTSVTLLQQEMKKGTYWELARICKQCTVMHHAMAVQKSMNRKSNPSI